MKRVLLLLVLVLGLMACTNPELCADIERALTACDLAAPEFQCEGKLILPGQPLTLLDEEGCEAFVEPQTRTPDPVACDFFGWPCPEPLFEDARAPDRLGPMVFVGGIDGNPLFDWNPELLVALAEQGLVVEHVPLPSWQNNDARTGALFDRLQLIAEAHGHQKLNLVCYAVGGLDCRHLVSPTGLFRGDPAALVRVGELVASVTTLSTPHRGTNIADAVLALPSADWSDLVLAGMVPLNGQSSPSREAQVRETLDAITLSRGAIYDAQHVDPDGIYLQSWAAVTRTETVERTVGNVGIASHCATTDGMDGFRHHDQNGHALMDEMSQVLLPIAAFAEVAEVEGARVFTPADGIVSASSARWGNFRGCVPADHYDLIGRFGELYTDPNSGFDPVLFYLAIARDLEARGL